MTLGQRKMDDARTSNDGKKKENVSATDAQGSGGAKAKGETGIAVRKGADGQTRGGVGGGGGGGGGTERGKGKAKAGEEELLRVMNGVQGFGT